MSVTKVDSNGRVLLPIGIRYRLDLDEGDELAIDYLDDGTIILKKIDQRISADVDEAAFQGSFIEEMNISEKNKSLSLPAV